MQFDACCPQHQCANDVYEQADEMSPCAELLHLILLVKNKNIIIYMKEIVTVLVQLKSPNELESTAATTDTTNLCS